MRRDKAATRILLILSVIHVAAAAPATIRKRPLQSTKDVRTALEKRANSDDESSHPLPRMDNGLPPTSGTLPSQEPAPGDPELHSDRPAELSGPPAELGTPQLHNGQPPTPGAPPSQDDTSSASEDPQLHRLHGDQSPGWQHTNWRPPGGMLQGELSGTAEIPPLHDDLSWEHADWHPLEETLQGESSVVPPLPDDQSWDELHNYWNSYLRTLQDASSEPHYWWPSQHNDRYSSWQMVQGESSEPPPLLDDQWGQHANLASPWETLYQGLPGMSSTTSGVSELQNDWHDGGSKELYYWNR
jgi:hypothetical protein